MSHEPCQHTQVNESKVLKLIPSGATILDCGCGYGSWARKVKIEVGVDVWKPYLEVAKKRYTLGVIQAHTGYLPLKDKSFDVALTIELIEHLTVEDGFKHLSEVERVARKRVILSTPKGFFDTKLPYPEKHMSGWDVNNFNGYTFEVMNTWLGKWLIGFKDLRNTVALEQ